MGGRKPRAQSTLDEYTRHLRRWWEWTCANLPAQSTTPTLRGVNAYKRVVRERSEHAFIGFLRAIKSWTTWLVEDGTLTEDPLASLAFVKPPKPHPDRTPVAELADMEAQYRDVHEQLARRCPRQGDHPRPGADRHASR